MGLLGLMAEGILPSYAYPTKGKRPGICGAFGSLTDKRGLIFYQAWGCFFSFGVVDAISTNTFRIARQRRAAQGDTDQRPQAVDSREFRLKAKFST
jgi:hypothetical protein